MILRFQDAHLFSIIVIVLPVIVSNSLSGEEPPGKLLDLSNWRLTLPVDTDQSEKPDEIEQPELESYIHDRYFFVTDKTGVVFRAHCGGVTTKNSSYPRCELREMTDSGKLHANWSTDDDATHALTLRAEIRVTPAVKPHVVCAQIHHAKDDLLMIRLEGKKLFIERDKERDILLDRDYKLGTPFDINIQAANGQVTVRYNDELKMRWRISRKGCYFKAGCYTQSNPKKGDKARSFGEVIIYRLRVEHRKNP